MRKLLTEKIKQILDKEFKALQPDFSMKIQEDLVQFYNQYKSNSGQIDLVKRSKSRIEDQTKLDLSIKYNHS